MRIGASLALLVLAAGACFSDNTPGGLSTASATSTGDSSTTGTSSTGAVTTGSATTGAAQTGSTGTSGTTDPGTTTTGAATGTTTGGEPSTGAGSSTSGPPDPSQCGQTDTAWDCQACCQEAVPGSYKYFDAIAECACVENSPCLDECSANLCADKAMSQACFACLSPMANERCSLVAGQGCLQDSECGPFILCLSGQQCFMK